MEIIKVEDLSFSYPKEEKKALDYVNLSLREGDFYVLFGKSGSGKSTLLRHLKKELTPVGTKSGQVYITSQNRGYTVSRAPKNAQIHLKNVNDATCEGLKYTDIPALSVQFNPGTGKSPLDLDSLITDFRKIMEEVK